MKYVCIDIETTGLNEDVHGIVEFGAIIEDTEIQLPFEKIPKFNVLVEHEHYVGSPFALSLHKEIFDDLSKPQSLRSLPTVTPDKLAMNFLKWLWKSQYFNTSESGEKIIVAGKNFGMFDIRFLRKIPHWNACINIHHRVIDPALIYFDPTVDKYELPGLDECKKRAGLPVTTIKHRAIRDAMDVIEVLRGKLYPKIN